jgi:ferrous iron transport protein B
MPVAEVASRELAVALVGNPNTGKSTLFNRLTGVRQRVGNYPGVTVERKTGSLTIDGSTLQVADLPGTYSLAAASPDERVVVDALAGRIPGAASPDAVVCVVDATNIKRNLFLASQVADLGLPMVIALNLTDAAQEQGLEIDVALLSERLGVPVIPTVATRGEGVRDVARAVVRAVRDGCRMRTIGWPAAVEEASIRLEEKLCGSERVLAGAELRRLLFDAESAILDRLPCDRTVALAAIAEAREELRKANLHPFAVETIQRYAFIDKILPDVVKEPRERRRTVSERVDAVLTNRFLGLLLFAGLMYVVFQSVYAWAVPLMDFVEWAKTSLQQAANEALESTPAVQSLVSDGIIEGVGSVLVFLPQIMILFGFIALLEDSGYMARAAFLMDRLLSWCGLNGKSFVPLLSSYACAVPGVLSTRTIEDPKARLVTILIAPMMSCSARLPVYVLLIGAFVQPRYGTAAAGLVLFLMHFLGLAVAIPTAWVFNRFLLKTPSQPFLLEMPPYRIPRPRDVGWRIFERSREFLIRAGTVIFAITVIIWALLYFPRPDSVREKVTQTFTSSLIRDGGDISQLSDPEVSAELEKRIDAAYLEQSWMGRGGKMVQPLFEAAGFDWKITVGVLSSFPAREVIIATLGIIYQLGGDVDEESGDLKAALASETWRTGIRAGQPVFTVPVALAIMVFFALCLQCGATVSVIAKESNWKWAVFAFVYMSVFAWIGAVLAYQVGTRFLPGA